VGNTLTLADPGMVVQSAAKCCIFSFKNTENTVAGKKVPVPFVFSV